MARPPDSSRRAAGFAMTVRLEREPERIELNALAARFFATSGPLEPERFGRLGAPTGDRPDLPLGRFLLERLRMVADDDGPALMTVDTGSGSFVASFRGDTCTLYAIADPGAGESTGRDDGESSPRGAGASSERERRHALRNQINTINMNAELIALLADQAQHTRIADCAGRIVDACRAATAALED